MNVRSGPNHDAPLFDVMLRVAREECAHAPWNDIEPMLAATWERLRSPSAPAWMDIVERVRACCQDAGTRH
ncbi:hypothetical protein [Agrilutibacter solisilvae]|uniref:Uncharacterized protein n=1 Tax=Agrilutibacter solisilvae TaxID=2763317 RepID=A0A974XWA4_9GAMM|nr:hypothetical protein [Lysobacter solisilvae]QSX77067.1 hypothetical protein I8J32_009625 [Lysobacter solisilvae]